MNKTDSLNELFSYVKRQNITAGSFYIERAEFSVKGNEEEKNGTGNIRFLAHDNFLVSVKTRTGIEIGRMLFSADSIKINDRINKNYYFGSVLFLKNKYGVETDILPLLLGDFIDDGDEVQSSVECINDMLTYEGSVKGMKIHYVLDCSLGKIVKAIPETGLRDSKIEITYSEFFSENGVNIPGRIVISEVINRSEVEIRLREIQIPWEGTIVLIPGKEYSKIPLK